MLTRGRERFKRFRKYVDVIYVLCTYLFSFDRQEYSERLFYSLFFTSSLALPLMAILCRHISNLCESQCQFNNFCHFGHQPIIQNQWPNWFVYLRGCMIFSWFKNDRGSFLCIKGDLSKFSYCFKIFYWVQYSVRGNSLIYATFDIEEKSKNKFCVS